MAVHQGELGQEAAVMDGQVSLADTAGLDPDDYLMGAGLGLGQIYDVKVAGGGILNRFHNFLSSVLRKMTNYCFFFMPRALAIMMPSKTI